MNILCCAEFCIQGVQSNWVRTALVNLIELLSFVGHLTHLQYTALGCAYAASNMAVMLWVSSVFVLSVADLGTKQCPLNWKLAPGTAMSWQHCSKSKLLAPLTTYIHFSLPRCYVSLQMHNVAVLTSSDEFTLPLNHKPLLQQVLKWKVAGNYQGTRSTPKHEMTWNGNSTEQGPGYRWVSPPSPVGWEIQEMLSPNVSKSTSIYVLQCCMHIGRVKSFH